MFDIVAIYVYYMHLHAAKRRRSMRRPLIFTRLFRLAQTALFLLFEVSVVKTQKRLAVAGFVTRHFVNGIMDSVQIESLCAL